jgi:hypothetical protein
MQNARELPHPKHANTVDRHRELSRERPLRRASGPNSQTFPWDPAFSENKAIH